jgi:cell division septum initiation protein DivIVA
MSQKLDTVEEVLHSEFNERKKLEAKVIELEKRLSASQKVEPTLTLTERLMSSGGMIQRAADKKPQAERSLADMRCES